MATYQLVRILTAPSKTVSSNMCIFEHVQKCTDSELSYACKISSGPLLSCRINVIRRVTSKILTHSTMTLLVDSECPDQTAQKRRLIWAFAVRSCPKKTFSHGAALISKVYFGNLFMSNRCTYLRWTGSHQLQF